MAALVSGPTHGTFLVTLAGAKSDGRFCYCDQKIEGGGCGPEVKGTPEDFIDSHGKEVSYQLKNKVKKCPNCKKVNAFTLPFCNGCGHSLREVEISYPNNVFAGFIYGIEKGPFPFTISIRHQSDSLLVFDDLMALTPCHVNCIPADVYVSDIRILFSNPERGLKLVDKMYAAAWGAIKTQFLSNKKWKSKVIRGGDKLDAKELEPHLICGFNYPPSQYWLHLQCMLPPLTPFHYSMYLEGRHYTYGRFFPFEYVREALEAKVSFPNAADIDVEELISSISSKGIKYDHHWQKAYSRYGQSHRTLANWDTKDFRRAILPGKKVVENDTFGPAEENADDLLKADKLILQNYGRPYKDGKPKGSYYAHAKKTLVPNFQ